MNTVIFSTVGLIEPGVGVLPNVGLLGFLRRSERMSGFWAVV